MGEYIEPYERLKKYLRAKGFSLKEEFIGYKPDTLICYVSGNGIIGMFGEPTYGRQHPLYDGRFAADNAECFNKITQAPFCVYLPQTDEACDDIHRHLKYLATEEAREWSSTFRYLDDMRLPYEVDKEC